ncbi:MAG: DUF5018 domain-containing protein [Burkholderiaceae bacterium]
MLTACSGGSSDPTTVAADFSAYGVKGTINGQNITIDLSGQGNCSTTVENMVIGVNANGASISPDPRVARDYSQPVQFTLTAPDGTKAVYSVTVKGAECLPTPAPTPEPTPTPADPAPIAGGAFAALADMTVSDQAGGQISINAGGVTDPLGRTIAYSVTGLPNDANGTLAIDAATGMISGIYDAIGIVGTSTLFTITVTATSQGGTHPISKTFVLSIRNDG